MKKFVMVSAIAAISGVVSTASFADSAVVGPDRAGAAASGSVDFENAKPMPLPLRPGPAVNDAAQSAAAAASAGPSGFSPGSAGTGVPSPTRVAPAKAISADGVSTQQYGTSNHPFSTGRVQLVSPATTPAQLPTSYNYPYRAAGKLFFRDGNSSYVCSASLIRRGVVVTAAHCVSAWGESRFYTNFQFVPAYHNGAAPYGVWTGTPIVMSSYFNGTPANCSVAGVVCDNDVAVIRIAPKTSAPTYPGTATGWYGWAYGNWGFTPSLTTLIDQLGYPVALDNGLIMERNDSQGFRSAANKNNTVIGSLMTGGSSGGPWLNNLGMAPTLGATTFGTYSSSNVVIGVTSWGYTSTAIKQQGASNFTASNIVPLVNAACASSNPGCL